ncbi:DUF6415 family natural product biosynthesis protein [Streptomyces stelliscabiei]|uniref:DUF6415 family natural product biosynthesis protein n=1 Tax=Streptomyces stelliscabiei TaxID=146820 RepID=UPI0029B6EFA6|nr:DUF6415 family natural product biosynthesis protein [Streptomyces stelliscabiei]MDX2667374.1 DUF6415 family natural product biosynthesis protein [Streptomyces stelliscabiei]MDX2785913.1 DUF6415 family natural product biosynthesis protein [Streptomyces stelliscabiei]
MPQRRTPEDRARRLALADQAADVWPEPPSATTETLAAPIDVAAMREDTRSLLVEGATIPSGDELETLTLQLRGYIMVAIPEVEAAAARLEETDVPRACALAGVREARVRLDLDADSTRSGEIAHVQRLARSVNALCDHYESLRQGA